MNDHKDNPYAAPTTDVTKPPPAEKIDESVGGPDYFWKIYIYGLLMCAGLVGIVAFCLWAF